MKRRSWRPRRCWDNRCLQRPSGPCRRSSRSRVHRRRRTCRGRGSRRCRACMRYTSGSFGRAVADLHGDGHCTILDDDGLAAGCCHGTGFKIVTRSREISVHLILLAARDSRRAAILRAARQPVRQLPCRADSAMLRGSCVSARELAVVHRHAVERQAKITPVAGGSVERSPGGGDRAGPPAQQSLDDDPRWVETWTVIRSRLDRARELLDEAEGLGQVAAPPRKR